MSKKNHPMQPIVVDSHGVHRFKENKLVRILLDAGGLDLNKLAVMTRHSPDYDEDWNQLAQLIGYSVSGFGDLSYADPKIVNRADKISDKISKDALAKKAIK